MKIYRTMLDWEWMDCPEMVTLFIHCILLANWKDASFHGYKVERGSFVTSYAHLAERTGLHVSCVRRCIKKLCETGEISVKSTNKFTLINVHNYAVFQQSEEASRQTSDTQATNKRHSNDTQPTTIEEEKEYKKNKKERKKIVKRKESFVREELPLYYDSNPIRSSLPLATDEEILKTRQILSKEKGETHEAN